MVGAGGDKIDLVRQPSVSLSFSPGINWLSMSWRSPDGLPSAIFTPPDITLIQTVVRPRRHYNYCHCNNHGNNTQIFPGIIFNGKLTISHPRVWNHNNNGQIPSTSWQDFLFEVIWLICCGHVSDPARGRHPSVIALNCEQRQKYEKETEEENLK